MKYITGLRISYKAEEKMGKEMIEFRQRVQNADKAAVYCAGEFASFLIQYCSVNGLADKIEYCIVTKRDPYTPAYI